MFGADTHGERERAISVRKFEGPSVFGESCAREPQDSPRSSTALAMARAVTSSNHEGEAVMQFILGVFLFVAVLGSVDALLPWPKPRQSQGVK
jgi:hypothetical protein